MAISLWNLIGNIIVKTYNLEKDLQVKESIRVIISTISVIVQNGFELDKLKEFDGVLQKIVHGDELANNFLPNCHPNQKQIENSLIKIFRQVSSDENQNQGQQSEPTTQVRRSEGGLRLPSNSQLFFQPSSQPTQPTQPSQPSQPLQPSLSPRLLRQASLSSSRRSQPQQPPASQQSRHQPPPQPPSKRPSVREDTPAKRTRQQSENTETQSVNVARSLANRVSPHINRRNPSSELVFDQEDQEETEDNTAEEVRNRIASPFMEAIFCASPIASPISIPISIANVNVPGTPNVVDRSNNVAVERHNTTNLIDMLCKPPSDSPGIEDIIAENDAIRNEVVIISPVSSRSRDLTARQNHLAQFAKDEEKNHVDHYRMTWVSRLRLSIAYVLLEQTMSERERNKVCSKYNLSPNMYKNLVRFGGLLLDFPQLYNVLLYNLIELPAWTKILPYSKLPMDSGVKIVLKEKWIIMNPGNVRKINQKINIEELNEFL